MADLDRPIRAVIADDEPLARRGVRQLLAPHRDVIVVAEARNGRETVEALRVHAPDLLFLDVQMPELDGFGVLREHGTARIPAVIFVTAHDEFAVHAFDAHAVHYLMKPLEEARFSEALERARVRLRASRVENRLRIPTSTGDLVIDAEEIEWIEADDYYAAIYVRGRRYLMRESLASLEQRLDPARFVRTHRSAIVNVARIREVASQDAETFLVLRSGMRVSVSRRRRERVTELLRRLVP